MEPLELTPMDEKDIRFLRFTDVAPFHIAAFAGWEREKTFTETLARIPAVRVANYYGKRYYN